jgi:hypothetical protein
MANQAPDLYHHWPITRRAGRACLNCRARKVKCNVEEQGQPCSNCLTDDVSCRVQKSKRGRSVWNQEETSLRCLPLIRLYTSLHPDYSVCLLIVTPKTGSRPKRCPNLSGRTIETSKVRHA